jgi:hypothetical protein
MNRRKEAMCKQCRRAFVERLYEFALKAPRAIGMMMQARGYYSPGVAEDDLEHFVNCILLNIRDQGFKHSPSVYIPGTTYPLQKQSRVSPWLKVVGPVFFPVEEPARADELFAPGEKCIMYELLFTGVGGKPGIISVTAERMERTLKSIKRQFEMVLHNEKCKTALDYEPTKGLRTWRTGTDTNVMEGEVIQQHSRRGIPVEYTSRVLYRPIDSIEILKERFARNCTKEVAL